MKLRSKPVLVLAAVALLLALYLIRPGAARLKTRIANSIGAALERQVEIGAVHVRLLPRPGFDIEGFVVHDEPSFSAEPVLRAQDVTASLRIASLLRGRLAISRLSLTEPSLNLVRREDGRWNIESFLERTAMASPSSAGASSSRPTFPYIEADRGRVNFKFGAEKKPFALTDAKYAFWQDSNNNWGMRIRGQPVRTDFNITDTGLVSVNGNWSRAATVYQTPIQFSAVWEEAQLGQLSKALSGEDRGWRGTVNVSVNGVGTPSRLAVVAGLSVRDFRRYDISENTRVDVSSDCKGIVNAQERSVAQVLCQVPLGDRTAELTGEVTHLSGPRVYNLQLAADQVPVASLLAVIRRAKKDLPPDLQATGTWGAKFTAHTNDSGETEWVGAGRTKDFHLISEANNTDLSFDSIPFSWMATGGKRPDRGRRPPGVGVLAEATTGHLSFGPFAVKLGRPSPIGLQGWIDRQGYSFSLRGDSEIGKLMEFARMSGIPSRVVSAHGTAKVDLQIAGPWRGFAGPVATGIAELHQVNAVMGGVNAPVEISNAKITLTPTEAEVTSLAAVLAETLWKGSLEIPRGCAGTPGCEMTFDLHADALSTEALRDWLSPRVPERAWYEISVADPSERPSVLAGIRASGTVAVDHFSIRNFEADRVTAKAELNRGLLHLSGLRADVLGGKHSGTWHADFTIKPPAYSGTGALEGVSLGRVAELMHDPWISGTAKAQYELALSGASSSELANSAKGTVRFETRDGQLPHITLGNKQVLVQRFHGELEIGAGEIVLHNTTLITPEASYAVLGKASLSQELDCTLSPQDGPAYRIAGTLSEPSITPARRSETQAALKPKALQ